MFVKIIENAAEYCVAESIRDEALGDLWEKDFQLERSGVSRFIRRVRAFLHFLLLIKASISLLLEEKMEALSNKAYPSNLNWNTEIYQLSADTGVGLTPSDIREIRQYCNTRRLYDSTFTKKLIGSPRPHNSYWIHQTDRIIEKCYSRGDKSIDCEAIVNSFMLSSLVKRLELVQPGRVDIDYLGSLVRNTYLTDEFINRYVSFDDHTYKRQLIFRTWSLAVYVISWKPGQESLMHHHGYALDAIRVIRGEMTHWLLPPEKIDSEVPFEAFRGLNRYEGPSDTFSTGDLVLVDRRHGHQLANRSDNNLVTLHFRFGHPPEDEHWRSTTDTEMFVWNQAEGCFDLIRPDRGRHSSATY